MSTKAHCYDVIVIGGGPAGATAATLVAQQGFDVLCLERERFPRFRIGESLMPATHWTLKRLGVLEKLEQSDFVRKHSVQFYLRDGRPTAPFYFADIEPGESAQTWQVERGAFDQLLLRHAAEQGVEVVERANVRAVLFDRRRATGVRVDLAGSGEVDLGAKVVIDASGQTGLLSRQFKLKSVDPKLRHISYFTRFSGVERACGVDAGATLIFWTHSGDSWFWWIPLPGDLLSVGVVGPIDKLQRDRGSDPQEVFSEELANCPALREKLSAGRQQGPVSVVRDFSYVSDRIAGDGWVLVGDAFGFLDPIYSTGVFLALRSAEFAADSVLDGLRSADTSAARLGRHGDEYIKGMEAFRKLVYAYYDRSFSFSEFLKQHPHCREPLVHLLIGNVFRKPIDPLIEALSGMIELPEERRLAAAEGGA